MAGAAKKMTSHVTTKAKATPATASNVSLDDSSQALAGARQAATARNMNIKGSKKKRAKNHGAGDSEKTNAAMCAECCKAD